MEVKLRNKPRYDFLKIWEVLRRFLSESIIFCLLQYPVHLSNKDSTISWILFFLLLIVSLASLFVSKGQQPRFFASFLCCVIPIMVLSKVLFNLPFSEIILLFLFSMWRLSVFMKEGNDDYEEFLEQRLLVTVLIFVSMYFICYTLQMQSRSMMIFFLFIQLFLYSYGTFIKRFMQSKSEIKNKKEIFIFGIFLFLIPIIGSILIVFIGGAIKQELTILLSKVFWFIAYLLNPIISGLIHFFGIHRKRFDKLLKAQEEKKLPEPDSQDNIVLQFRNDQEHTFIFMCIILLVIGAWAYWKFKNMKITNNAEKSDSLLNPYIQYYSLEKNKLKRIQTNYYSKSNQQIRKFVFDMEKFAMKGKVERYEFESIREWLMRFNIQASNEWFSIYENVRYGENHVSTQDVRKFAEEMKEIKRQLKEKLKR